MGKGSVEAPLRWKSRRRPTKITTLLYIVVAVLAYRYLRQDGESSHTESKETSSSNTFAKYIEKQNQALGTGAERWSQSSMTIHIDAGPQCLQKWFKTGESCNATSFVHPPLDLVWLWQNAR